MLISMANLAVTYQHQGRLKEAEELDVQVMEARMRVLGQEHPDTLSSMNKLAVTYQNQGRWKEAEELEVKVVETGLRVWGQEHPDTLRSMANLASIYQNQERWKEAEELEVKVVETRKRVLGEEHQVVDASGDDVSWLLDQQQSLAQDDSRGEDADKIEVVVAKEMKKEVQRATSVSDEAEEWRPASLESTDSSVVGHGASYADQADGGRLTFTPNGGDSQGEDDLTQRPHELAFRDHFVKGHDPGGSSNHPWTQQISAWSSKRGPFEDPPDAEGRPQGNGIRLESPRTR